MGSMELMRLKIEGKGDVYCVSIRAAVGLTFSLVTPDVVSGPVSHAVSHVQVSEDGHFCNMPMW